MNLPQTVISTSQWVMDQAQHVTIKEDKLQLFIERMSSRTSLQLPNWDDGNWHYSHDVKSFGIKTAQYIFVLDALNFCFWPSSSTMEYDTLAIGLRKALELDTDVFTPQRLQMVTEQDIQGWIQLAGPITTNNTNSKDNTTNTVQYHTMPNLPERVLRLRELGTMLLHYYNGNLLQFISQAKSSAVELVRLITATFPGFRDEAVYKGHHIRFYKRAQILVGDLWAAYGRLTCTSVDSLSTIPPEQQPFTFYDMDQLTCFADYRIPQLLRMEGVIEYSPKLANTIDTYQELLPSSEEEIEIRASTVIVVEKIRQKLNRLLHHQQQKDVSSSPSTTSRLLTSVEIDWYLWQEGEERKDNLLPHHRVNTIFY